MMEVAQDRAEAKSRTRDGTSGQDSVGRLTIWKHTPRPQSQRDSPRTNTWHLDGGQNQSG